MPYRIDLAAGLDAAGFDRLIELGAIDAEVAPDGSAAALMPDSVPPDLLARALGVADLAVSAATSRDAGSVWMLRARPVRIGRLQIVPAAPASADAEAGGVGTVRLLDGPAFGTGFHATTALCLEALQDIVDGVRPAAMLDVGTGSGVLALAALRLGVPRVLGIDIDEEALGAAGANGRMNGVGSRLTLARGGPERLSGAWPLVVANVLAAPLIEMAPALARRVAHQGTLVLSGIPAGVERDVDDAYRHLGMRRLRAAGRSGWTALVLQASW